MREVVVVLVLKKKLVSIYEGSCCRELVIYEGILNEERNDNIKTRETLYIVWV